MYSMSIIERLIPKTPKTVAVAAAEDGVVLRAVVKSYQMGIAKPILCGVKREIQQIAQESELDISPFEVIDLPALDAAAEAVSLVNKGHADMLMKGMLQTADLLRAVLDRENGLRKNKLLSHVSIFHSPVLDRTMLLTDAAMVMYPDLLAKSELIKNAVQAAQGMGIPCPKVAPLAAVEVVNPDMQATLDAALLTVMNHRGQIKGCVIDGPLAMDLAISPEAAAHKKIESAVAGCADILLMHNIEAANSTLKTFTFAGNSLFGGVIMGAKAPIVLTSRADSQESKLYSIACAAHICNS